MYWLQNFSRMMGWWLSHSMIAGLDPIFQANSVAWPIAHMTSQLELMMGLPVSGFHLAIAGSALQAGNAVGRGRSQAGKSQFRKKAFSGSGILNPYPQPSKIFWRFRVFLYDRVSDVCKCMPLSILMNKVILLNLPWSNRSQDKSLLPKMCLV